VTHHGHLSRVDLQAALRRMHFGMISISPLLYQPGFPSKTFDYLAAGLPILYLGRPLPYFTKPLSDAGLCIALDGADGIDLVAGYARLSKDFDRKREDFLAQAALKWSAVDHLL
jgi:hypothetical protein